MRVVALISGGKDSCYNMVKCVQNGHEVVALANLYPIDKDEIDSYMFQSVGHQVIGLFAQATNLPLYRQPIKGTSKLITSGYHETEGDEVEDLYQLLLEVKTKECIEAVSVGAILSSYQRTRVENVLDLALTGRLNEKHLGLTLRQMQPHLLKMSEKYGLNVCGEGGEYETLTLDCPIFRKKIIINDSRMVIHSSDAFAPVAYLIISDAGLVSK